MCLLERVYISDCLGKLIQEGAKLFASVEGGEKKDGFLNNLVNSSSFALFLM